MTVSPTTIVRDFEKAVDAYLRPSVLSANPSVQRRRHLVLPPSLLNENAVEVYAFPNHQFQLNYISQEPLRLSEAWNIDYITMTVQPFFTFGGGNHPNKISIMVRVFVKDTQGENTSTIKNVLLNHIVSTNPSESYIHVFYDTTIPIHNNTYRDLKPLIIKLWMDTRAFLYKKSLHGEPETPLYQVLRNYINALPLTPAQRDTMINDLFNKDAVSFSIREDKMIIREFGQPNVEQKEYGNYIDFLREGKTDGGRLRLKKKRAPSAKAPAAPTAPSAKAKAKSKAKSKKP